MLVDKLINGARVDAQRVFAPRPALLGMEKAAAHGESLGFLLRLYHGQWCRVGIEFVQPDAFDDELGQCAAKLQSVLTVGARVERNNCVLLALEDVADQLTQDSLGTDFHKQVAALIVDTFYGLLEIHGTNQLIRECLLDVLRLHAVPLAV